MPFRKPERTAIRPRVLIIGDAKVGKTHALLTFPGPLLAIDCEARMEVFEDRFNHFEFDDTKNVRQIKEDLRAVREGRYPCATLGIDGLSVLYEVLQGAAMSATGEIEVNQWGAIKRTLSSVLDEAYHQLPCMFVATSRIKPKVVLDRKKGIGTSELYSEGDVIDLDRKAAYLFDLMFRIRMNAETRRRDVICLGSIYEDIQVGQVWALPDGARFYDLVVKPLVDARSNLAPARVGTQTDEQAVDANRSLFQRPPTMAALAELAEMAGIRFTLDWVATQDIVRVDLEARPPIRPLSERKVKGLFDEEKLRAKAVLERLIEANEAARRDRSAVDVGAGEPTEELVEAGFEASPAPRRDGPTSPPKAEDLRGAPKITNNTQRHLMGMLNKRDWDGRPLADRDTRLEYVFALGLRHVVDGAEVGQITTFSDLLEPQAVWLAKHVELIPPRIETPA